MLLTNSVTIPPLPLSFPPPHTLSLPPSPPPPSPPHQSTSEVVSGEGYMEERVDRCPTPHPSDSLTLLPALAHCSPEPAGVRRKITCTNLKLRASNRPHFPSERLPITFNDCLFCWSAHDSRSTHACITHSSQHNMITPTSI